jgi:tyramine---L-glutamate ligase
MRFMEPRADSTTMKRVWVYEYLSGGGDFHGDELLAMGVSMRDAMVADLLRAEGCSVTAATCARASSLPHGAAGVQAHGGESPAAFVARQAAAHDAVWLVAPETGGLLALLQRAVEPARWLGCDAASIALASSKRATTECLAACGVLTPLAFADDPSTRRWVTKPDDGAGAVDTRVHADPSAARDHAGGSAVIEPWVEGAAMSLSLLCRPGHFELLSVNRQWMNVATCLSKACRSIVMPARSKQRSSAWPAPWCRRSPACAASPASIWCGTSSAARS